MVILTRDNFRKVKDMVKERSLELMDLSMQVSGNKTKLVAMGNLHTQTVATTKEDGN